MSLSSISFDTGKPILQAVGESRLSYLKKARKYAAATLAELIIDPEYGHCHISFAIRDALLATETKFKDLGTFGVEFIAKGHNKRSPSITYLNTGDTYEMTILRVRGQFRVGCWGDIVERGNYS